jgi:hypothetical protein
MARQHVFSKGMQQVLGLPDKRIPVIQTIQNNSLAATRCRRDVPFDAMTNLLPREDAYMIVIQIRGKNARELWLDGRPIKTEPLHAGGVVFHDLRQTALGLPRKQRARPPRELWLDRSTSRPRCAPCGPAEGNNRGARRTYAACFTASIRVASLLSAFELLTRLETGHLCRAVLDRL